MISTLINVCGSGWSLNVFKSASNCGNLFHDVAQFLMTQLVSNLTVQQLLLCAVILKSILHILANLKLGVHFSISKPSKGRATPILDAIFTGIFS